ncbi:hypothetical protein ACT3CD_01675 [Geofilum sp. OHC36d9]|uniref:hypothetical protein n=1 Tax=Geofilum sp. OHC36d9 TaxID=3458413 RepID=UPI00403488D4
MEMSEKPTVELEKRREFSEVINATFSFVGQEFKSLLTVVALYAGLFILASTVLAIVFSGNQLQVLLDRMQSGDLSGFSAGNFSFLYVSYLFSLLCIVVLSGLVSAYMVVYAERGRRGFVHADVWKTFIASFVRLLLLSLLILLIFGLVAGVGSIVIGVLATLSMPVIVKAIVIFFAVIALIAAMCYVWVPLSLSHIVLYNERNGVFNAISRSFSLVKGNWWLSFGVVFVLGLVVTVLSSFFSIPAFMSGLFKGITAASGEATMDVTSMSFVLTTVISSLGQYFIYPLIFVGVAIHYFNLRERYDNNDLLRRVEQMSEEA